MATIVSFVQDSARIKIIDSEAYQQEIQKEQVQIVDVRTPGEYATGHIGGAENIDFLAEGFLPKFEKFDKEKPIYIYCRSGNRSRKAAANLLEMGFLEVIDLEGGYKAWTAGE